MLLGCEAFIDINIALIAVLQISTKALESDTATMDLVFVMLGYLSKHCNGIEDDKVKEVMTASLEDRWQSYDQPLYLLAYILNPARKRKHLSATCDFVSLGNLACLLEVVYQRLFGTTPPELTDQFVEYMTGDKRPFTRGKLRAIVLH